MPRSVIKTKHRIVASIEADLIKHVRKRNGASRVDLARALRLAPSTAGIYVDRLKREGLLIEGELAERKHGRRPTLLLPNPRAGRFVGIDFEAHTIMTTVVDFSLQALNRSVGTINKSDSVERIIRKIEDSVHSALAGDSRPLLGVGVGVPGVFDAKRGTASSYEFIDAWKNTPVASLLGEKFDVPVHVENNVRCMALAELWLGQGRGLRNFVCLGVRTGLGVAIVLEGELLRGERGAAGEIGHWPALSVRGGARLAGKKLEEVTSLDTLFRAASEVTGEKMDMAAFRGAVEVGNHQVRRILEEVSGVLAATIRQIYFLLDPERIIIVGPMAEFGAALLTPLTASAELRPDNASPLIVTSSFGQFGGALGAAALALHRWKPTRA